MAEEAAAPRARCSPLGVLVAAACAAAVLTAVPRPHTLRVHVPLPSKTAPALPSRNETADRRLYVVVRAFQGAAHQFASTLAPSFDTFLFLGPRVRLTIVLDDESPGDHAWGDQLMARYAAYVPYFVVRYAVRPPAHILRVAPFLDLGGRYASEGYTRQLWDTFWLDTYLPPDARPDDLMAMFDTDAALNTVLDPALLLTPAGRLHPAALSPNHFLGDDVLLGWAVEHDTMWTDVMPAVWFVGTLAALRAHAGALAKPGGGMDDAWRRLDRTVPFGYDGRRHISPSNIIFNYGLRMEPARYEFTWIGPGVDGHQSDNATRAEPQLASNRPPGRRFIRAGCCRAYRLPGCTPAEAADYAHVTSVGNADQWPEPLRAAAAERAYTRVHRYVAAQPAGEVAKRHAACAAHVPTPLP